MGWFLVASLPLQGYDPALLPLTVAGIPSIHICLDFIPELLAQPQLEKQVKASNAAAFSLDLNPPLALQWSYSDCTVALQLQWS